MEALDRRTEIADHAGAAGILKERTEYAARIEIGSQWVTDDDLPSQRLRPRLHHRDGLGMAVAINEKCQSLRSGDAAGHGHSFCRSGCFIEQRGVRNFEPGEIGNHGLEVEQGLQTPLADLRLVGGIGGVPGRTFQDVSLDHRWQNGAIIALSDERGENLVFCGHRTDRFEHLRLRECRAEIERRGLPN